VFNRISWEKPVKQDASFHVSRFTFHALMRQTFGEWPAILTLLIDNYGILHHMEMLRLLIIADDPLARAGLAMLLSDAPECVIAGQINSAEAMENGWEADLIGAYRPDVIIWDFGWDAGEPWPDWQGINLPIVALLPQGADAAGVWAAGACSLLHREMDPGKLLAAARAAVQGLVALDAEVARSLLPGASLSEAAPSEELTPRESEVLQLLAEGLTNKAVAHRLDISEHTVKFHVNAIMSKLGAQSRTEAVVRATRLGLILL
jgi:DNA-binding NarL/FixJ family response regulator